MQKFLRKVFGIYPGEGRTTLRFARFSIYWAFSTLTLENLSDGLFLENIGAGFLPYVYLYAALTMILISSIVVYALRIVSPYQILRKVMIGGALLTGICLVMLSQEVQPSWFWYGVKIFSRLFFSVFLACAWTFIDQYHDLQEAKRVYSLYSAAYFFGIVLSGLVISLLLSVVGYPVLYSIVFCSICLAFWEAKKIVERVPAVHDDTIEGVFSGDRNSFSILLQLLKKSPYTLCLLAVSLLAQFMTITTEFNYMEIFQKVFQASSPDLSSNTASQISGFLAKTRGAISLGNLFVGAFLYAPSVRRFGLNNIILLTPSFFLFVYFGLVYKEALWIAILGLIAVEGVLFTVEDNSFNLLTKAVPAKLKSKVRIINDSFFEPIGMLICSFFLFFFESGSRWLGFTFSFIFLAVTFLLRKFYPKAIYTSLKENALHFERRIRDWLLKVGKKESKEAKKDLLKALKSSQEEIVLLSLEGLLSYEDPHLLDQICRASKKLSSEGKKAFISLIENNSLHTHPLVLEQINDWFENTESRELFEKTYFFLARQGLLHPDKVMEDLDSENLLLRGAAILTLKKSQAPLGAEQGSLHKTIAQKETSLLLQSQNEEEILLGLTLLKEIFGPEGAEKAFLLLNHPSIAIKRQASIALAESCDKSFSPFLPKILEEIEENTDPVIRKNYLLTLGKVGDSSTVKEILQVSKNFRPSEKRLVEQIVLTMGLKTVPILLAFLKEANFHYPCRVLAAKILAQLSLPQLRAHLEEIIAPEKKKAYFTYYHALIIQNQYPENDLHLLEDALLSRSQTVIDFIIHLLGSVGSVEDCELLVHSFRSKSEKVRSNAIESLEKYCDSQIFTWLLPLIEEAPKEEKIYRLQKYDPSLTPFSLEELLDELHESPSLSDKVIAAQLKAELEIPNWKETLKKQMKTSEEAFHHFAYELLER